MKSLISFKRELLTIALVLLLNSIKAQSLDTAFYFFRNSGGYPTRVFSVDSADFIRIIMPFRLSDDLVDVKEVYKDGKLRMVSKGISSTFKLSRGIIDLDGICIYYYPNGRRKSIIQYKENQKVGTGYDYYPDGKPHQIVNYKFLPGTGLTQAALESFFDKDGREICKAGEGHACDYNESFKVLRWGPVHFGLMNGEWNGYVTGRDSAKYKIVYKDDTYTSGISYDTSGTLHHFTNISEYAEPLRGRFIFVEHFRKLVKQNYKKSDAGKMLDTAVISFTINEDGSLSNLEPLNAIPADAVAAMKVALSSCVKWKPATTYGIPVKATMGIALHIDNDPKSQQWVIKNEGSQIRYYNEQPIGESLVNSVTAFRF